MSLAKQVQVSNTVQVHISTAGKVKAGKFFCVCGHCDHHLQSDCVRKGCWCCSVLVRHPTDILLADQQATPARVS